MSSNLIAAAIFASTFGGALFGIFVRRRLPAHHLDDDSKDTVKLIMGLIATLTALVLSLLISSAHSAFDTQTSEVQQLGVHLIPIDRILAQFGQAATQPRALLRKLVAADLDRTGRVRGTGPLGATPLQAAGEQLFSQIASLSPETNLQRFGQARALQLLATVLETHRLLTEQAEGSLSWVFLVVLGAWLTLLFFGFGLFAPFNRTVVFALCAGALSVAAAVFVILDMSHPYSGSMQVSSVPLRDALNQMNE